MGAAAAAGSDRLPPLTLPPAPAPARDRDRSMVMASAGVNNMPAGPGAGADGADHASECRLRRRRRLAPLRPVASTSAGSDESAAAAAADTPHSSDSSEEDSDGSAAAINLASSAAGLPAVAGAAAVWPVAFGSVALAGRLREMEDTVSLHPSFCVWADGSPMHFFAVFDGHGGAHVAALCREQMHGILATELAAAAEHYLAHRDEDGSEERAWRAALSRSFARVDALAPEACACGRAAAAACACPLSSEQRGAIVGSTAVLALLVRDRVVLANCGDSRAVLCRGARAVPLSQDQKVSVVGKLGYVWPWLVAGKRKTSHSMEMEFTLLLADVYRAALYNNDYRGMKERIVV